MMLQNGNPNAEIKFPIRKKCNLDVRNGKHNPTSSNSTTLQQKKTIWLTLENSNVIQMLGKHREPQRFAFLLSSVQNTINSFLINSSKSDFGNQEKKLVGFLNPNFLCCLSPSSHRTNKIKMHGQIYPNPISSADTILALNPFCFFQLNLLVSKI
jgi:hypothetical protein